MSEWNSLLMHVSLYRAVHYRAASAGQYITEQSRAVHYRAQYIIEQNIIEQSRAEQYIVQAVGTGQGAEYYRAVYIIEQSSIL